MKFERKSIILALITLLVVGPLQAQQVFDCEMMDTKFYNNCCCDNHNHCADADCDDDVKIENSQCCDESIELKVDNNTKNVNIIKSAEIRSNVDPPAAITSTIEQFFQPVCFSDNYYLYTHLSGSLGSNTYLITQRFRI